MRRSDSRSCAIWSNPHNPDNIALPHKTVRRRHFPKKGFHFVNPTFPCYLIFMKPVQFPDLFSRFKERWWCVKRVFFNFSYNKSVKETPHRVPNKMLLYRETGLAQAAAADYAIHSWWIKRYGTRPLSLSLRLSAQGKGEALFVAAFQFGLCE